MTQNADASALSATEMSHSQPATQPISAELPSQEGESLDFNDTVKAVETKKSNGSAKNTKSAQQIQDDIVEFSKHGKIKKTDLEKYLDNYKNFQKGMYQAQEKAAKAAKAYQALQSGDFDQIAQALEWSQDKIESYVQRKAEQAIRQAQMTPEQREIEQYKSQAEEAAMLKKQFAEYQQQQQREALTQQVMSEYDQAFKSHYESRSGLPYTRLDAREMAMVMDAKLNDGIVIDWDTAAEQMLVERNQRLSGWLTELAQADAQGAQVAKVLPKPVIEWVRKHLLGSSQRSAPQTPTQMTQPKPAAPRPAAPEKMNLMQWREYVRNR